MGSNLYSWQLIKLFVNNKDLTQLTIGELFKMDYSAVSQAAKRFEQKSKVNDKIKESLQKVITALKEIWMSNVETWPLYYYYYYYYYY